MAAVLIQCGRQRGVRSTGVLFTYWLLQLVTAVLALQTHARNVAAGVLKDISVFILLAVISVKAVFATQMFGSV